jgi:O-antigen/teichoic acid export membrane protein
MAILRTEGDLERNRLFWTSAYLTTGLAIVAAIVFYPIASVLISHMDVTASVRAELVQTIWLLVLAVPLGMVQSLFSGTLEGRRAFGPLNATAIGGNLLTATLPLLCAWTFGPNLPFLVGATLGGRFLTLALQFGACLKIVPLSRPLPGRRDEVAELIRFGGWVTVSGVISPLLVSFDRFAVGAVLGGASVGFYVIGFNLVSQLQSVPSALARAMFPRFAELSAEESHKKAGSAFLVLLAVLTPMTVLAMLLVLPFLNLWLGEQVGSITGPITVVLLLGFWANSLAFLNFSRIQAMNRPDLTAKTHLLEVVPYVLLLWFALREWGLTGAAIAWTARVVVDFLILLRLDQARQKQVLLLAHHSVLLLIIAAVLFFRPSGLFFWLASAVGLPAAALLSWKALPKELLAEAISFFTRKELGVD